MASTSFSLSNHINSRNFSAIQPPSQSPTLRHSLRICAACATAASASATGTEIASKTASFYEVLGIQTGATCQEIKFAYRKLARTLHPDVASKYGDDDASSADEFMRVHTAYATLSDPEKRAMYDSTLYRRRRRPTVTSASGYSRLARRGPSWETDQCW